MILSVGLSVGVFLYDKTLSAQCSRVGLLFGCFFFLSYCFVILLSLLRTSHALNGVSFCCLHPLPMVVGPQCCVVSRPDRKNSPCVHDSEASVADFPLPGKFRMFASASLLCVCVVVAL